MKKGFSYLKKRKNGIIAYLIMIIFMATSVLPAYADDEWSDEEKQEDAWMTYLMTNWPIDELHVTIEGATYADDTVYYEQFDMRYSPLIEEMFNDWDYLNEIDCMHDPESYKDIMRFLCGSLSRITLNAGDGSSEIYDYIDTNTESFEMSALWSLNENGEYVSNNTCYDNEYVHNKNDIAFIRLFIDKNYTPQGGSDREKQLDSLRRLFIELVKYESDGMATIGDIYESNEQLAGMLLRICCPKYDYPYYDAYWFQDHMAKMCHDYPDKLKSGEMYPWVLHLGLVDENGTIDSSMCWGENFGDLDGDGIVDVYSSTASYDTQLPPGEHYMVLCEPGSNNGFSNCYEGDPSFLASSYSAYTGVHITYTIDNYQYWGTDAVDELNSEDD